MTLWHFTCSCSVDKIGRRGELVPVPQIWLEEMPLVWLTDQPVAHREKLGLTSDYLSCDRTEFRYRVTDSGMAVPWSDSRARRLAVPQRVFELEFGRRPDWWYVSEVPVPVVRA